MYIIYMMYYVSALHLCGVLMLAGKKLLGSYPDLKAVAVIGESVKETVDIHSRPSQDMQVNIKSICTEFRNNQKSGITTAASFFMNFDTLVCVDAR